MDSNHLKQPRLLTQKLISLTRTVGIEPTFTGLESVALPLYYVRFMRHDTPKFQTISSCL